MDGVAYTIEAVHVPSGEPIVALRLSRAEGEQIIAKLWPNADVWGAPGGSSIALRSESETAQVSAVLGNQFLVFDAARHRWVFHVHLA
jgi:hypothetical protein